VIDVEHGGLARLEEHRLALVERAVQHERRVIDHGAQALGELQQFLHDLVDLDGATVVDLHEQVVLLVERALDLLAQDVLVEEVLDADADAVDLVGVRRPDAATGRADLALAEEPLRDLVEGAVVVRDDVRVGADTQAGDIDTAGGERIELLEQHLDVDDDTVGDDRDDARGEDARWQQVQRVLLVADDDGVASVVATVELDDVVDAVAEEVGGLAFTFVAPLGADEHDCGHARSSQIFGDEPRFYRVCPFPRPESWPGASVEARDGSSGSTGYPSKSPSLRARASASSRDVAPSLR
jgi:hypothetical protein